MKNRQSSYWKFLHAVVRVGGCIWMAGGVIIALCSLITLRGSKRDPFTKWGGVSAGLVVAILGFLLLKARPSNPREFWKRILEKWKGH
jgi:hypothetical protein